MSTRGRSARLPWTIPAVWVLAWGVSVGAPAPAPAQGRAEEILKATGVTGGLIVHLGCGDGTLTAALGAGGPYVVHGLDAEAANIGKAREHIRKLGLCGKVSVDRRTGKLLPYVDNLVSLLVSQDPGGAEREEILRVLRPGGVAYVQAGGTWTKTVKPRPKEIDEWTHYLHDATGNAVANDRVVGPPRHMQWLARPTWSRNHHKLASISAVVSAGGRIFYIMDEATAASTAIPGKWFLVARDAFSGVLLWTRAMSSWAWHGQKFRSGPVQLPRTLVAAGNRVYAPLGMNAPVSALDAVGGKTVRTYEGTEGAEEVVWHDGVVLVVAGSPEAEQAGIDPARRGKTPFPNEKRIVAVRAETGEILWKWADSPEARLMPLTVAAAGKQVFFQAGKAMTCVECATGKELWRSGPAAVGGKPKAAEASAGRKAGKAAKGRRATRRKKGLGRRSVGWSQATVVVHDGVVLWANAGRLSALSAETGKALWNCPCKAGFRSPTDLFVIGGLVWLGPGFTEGRDLKTGEVQKTNDVLKGLRTAGHHHRCHREKGTSRYILDSHRGIEFVDLVGENHSRNNWVRGGCQYGILPCNGLIYAPSHACGCFMEAKLYGFWALSPAGEARESRDGQRELQAGRLERGPAYGQVGRAARAIAGDAWPTLRGNPLRSGSTTMQLPARLAREWQVRLGGRLSAPVAAGGSVVVSSIDTHRVVALDAGTGRTRWSFQAGGRVDSPPTLHAGLALFGCADGRIYALRLSDGEPVWRFQAAPQDRRTVVFDQVESVWPVHGSVLVAGGVAYAAAGRSSWVDGGIYLYGLDPATGKVVCRSRVQSRHPKGAEGKEKSDAPHKKFAQNATDYKTFGAPDHSDAFSMGGATTDVMVSDGESIFLRHLRFDRTCVQQPKKSRHLFSTTRLLDDAEVHRSHWVLGTGDFSRLPVAYSWIANSGGGRFGSRLAVPYGLLLAFDATTVWGARRGGRAGGYTLFAEAHKPFSADEPALPDFRKSDNKGRSAWKWSANLAMRPRAILRAHAALLLGGMATQVAPDDPHAAFEGRKGGLLWTMSTADGGKLAEYKLDSPPVWDGLAAAGGRLYIATMDGRVLALGNAALRTGKKLHGDAPHLKVTNAPEAN